MPSCDVILPVFNGEHTVLAAVYSILNQTHDDLRLIVMDDGSSDQSMSLLRGIDDARLVLIEHDRNVGLSTRLNEAVQLATAPYVARMDADDIAHPERIEKQIAVLESDKTLDLVGCSVVTMDQSGRLIGTRKYPCLHEEILRRPYRSIPIAHPAWCGRKEWFKRNPYDARNVRCEDQALLRRAKNDSRFCNLPDFLLAYREASAVRPRATLRSRWFNARHISSIGASEGHPISSMIGAAGVLARWPLDVLSWVSGNPKMAGHRFQQLGEEDERTWRRIIEDVGEAGSR